MRNKLLIACSVASCVVVWLATALIYGPGEHFWVTTFVLFGPTWLLQLPLGLAVLVWLCFLRKCYWLGALLLCTELLLNFSVLGFSVPWRKLLPEEAGSAALRIVTWNMDGQKLSSEDLARFFDDYNVDIALMQECGGLPPPPNYPSFQMHNSMGMCMLSRLPLTTIADRDRHDVWEASGSGAIVRYTFAPSWGRFTLTNVQLETPREGFEEFLDKQISNGIEVLSAKNQQRYTEAALAFDWTHQGDAMPRLVAGDFNTPPQSDLLRNTWKGYSNCFGVVGWGFGHSKFTRLLGVRIDHMLASPEWSCTSSKVLLGFTSDHSPLLTEVVLRVK